jgi:hypothetical protein
MYLIYNYVYGVLGFVVLTIWTGFEFKSLVNSYKILDESINNRVNRLLQSRYSEKVINLDYYRQL